MKTKFDESKTWVNGLGKIETIVNMETSHLMNIIKMFAQKPHIIMKIIIDDIEKYEEPNLNQAWTPNEFNNTDFIKESINNVTSMNENQIISYALNSNLATSIFNELQSRGVNVDNFVDMILNSEN